MLPDLPKVKRELYLVQIHTFHNASKKASGVFSDCNTIPSFEGDQHGVNRSSGETEVNPFWKLSAEIEIKPQSETLDSIFEKIYNWAEKIGKQLETNSFDYLNKTCESTGQTISAKDKNLEEAIFEMMQKVEIPLNEEGKLDLSGMKVVCGSATIEAIKKIEQTPELKEKFDRLLETKQSKAIAREANRELVG